MEVQSRKAKGRRLQQHIVKVLLDAVPELEPDDITSRSMGANGEDIILSPLARKHIPFSIEAKYVEKINIWDAIKQAEANSNGHIPLVVIKRNRSDVYAILKLDHLKGLLWQKK